MKLAWSTCKCGRRLLYAPGDDLHYKCSAHCPLSRVMTDDEILMDQATDRCPDTNLRLVKYSCGCIGFPPNTNFPKTYILFFCDSDPDTQIQFSQRVIGDKRFSPITFFDEEMWLKKLDLFLSLGHSAMAVERERSSVQCFVKSISELDKCLHGGIL